MAVDDASATGKLTESDRPSDDSDESSAAPTKDTAAQPEETKCPADQARWWTPKSGLRLAMVVGLVLLFGLGGLAGWLGFRASESTQAQQRHQLLLSAGRQCALNLTTIDWEHADADVRRVLDSATGTFYDDFSKRSQPFVEVVKQAKSKSVGTIAEAGFESLSDNEAQVLVAVMVKTTNAGGEQDPHGWRMRLSVQLIGDEAKVSNVAFVP